MKWLLVVALGGCTDSDGPRLHEVTPASATVGASVQLRGERFCGVTGECSSLAAKVDLGLDPPTVQAVVLAYTGSTATIQIPPVAPVGPTEIVMTVNGQSSNALAFEVLP